MSSLDNEFYCQCNIDFLNCKGEVQATMIQIAVTCIVSNSSDRARERMKGKRN